MENTFCLTRQCITITLNYTYKLELSAELLKGQCDHNQRGMESEC